jgi:hypothetical protein
MMVQPVTRISSRLIGLGLIAVTSACSPVVTQVPCVIAPQGYVIPDEKWTPYARCPVPAVIAAPTVPGAPGHPDDPDVPHPPPPRPEPEAELQYSVTRPGELALAVEDDERSITGEDGAFAIDGDGGIHVDASKLR